MELVRQFEQLWNPGASPPDVFEFLQQPGTTDSDQMLAVLLADQARRWATRDPLRVEDYLSRLQMFPFSISWKPSLAKGELDARRNTSQPMSAEEIHRRFPDISDELLKSSQEAKPVKPVKPKEDSPRNSSPDPWRTNTHFQELLPSDLSYISTRRIGDHDGGRYRMLRELGKGAFGQVYLCYDQELQRQVAVKVPNKDRFHGPDDAQSYLTEARTVAELDDSRIVPVYDVGRTEDGGIYVVSKFIDGGTLEERMKARQLSHREAAQLLATVSRALQHAHQKRLVHRDIKPANILIEESTNEPHVADFGLAVREEESVKQNSFAGTPAYMSPEQARGEGHRLDGRSDLFSLGVIMYELLTGTRPFSGTMAEIRHQIISADPRSPREIVPAIPPELERICLKALAKRLADRYASGREIAEDLEHWLAPTTVIVQAKTVAPVIPKGLRSFDANDAEFFLDLLPGIRNREGLPESIDFWKRRIETVDRDQTFSVGLIYGPSGCGKSSLVRAGLLPRLAKNVLVVFVEATADETESRILRGLREALPQLTAEMGLAETLTSLRRASGSKVVIIIDQFEQWLHAHHAKPDTELVTALRQCDGLKLQCILMVRDDFWLAVKRFMDEVEVELIQGRNVSLVDLFSVEHAQKVLARFGQAYERFPGLQDITAEQRAFIATAVQGLSEDEKVICVHLSLFAEMVKNKSWQPSTLAAMGGSEGIGVSFLEETFASRSANPKHRLHQAAARSVLKALLPAVGTNIKGHMRSYGELLEVSGYGSRPAEFNDLLRILDVELKLITPTDPEGQEHSSEIDLQQQYYQLTHDFLVPALREWLERKQKETRRGRAELKLAERAAIWTAKPENRHLPSLRELLTIRVLTQPSKWSPPETKMMARAATVHATRWGISMTLILLTGFGIQNWLSRKTLDNLQQQMLVATDTMQNVRGAAVPFAIRDLREKYPENMVIAELTSRFAKETAPGRKLGLAFALAEFGIVEADFLISEVENRLVEDAANHSQALSKSSETSLKALRAAAAECDTNRAWVRKSRLAILALQLGDVTVAEDICRTHEVPDPEPRTAFISELPGWTSDVGGLAKTFQSNTSSDLRSAACLGVGSIPEDRLSPEAAAVWLKLATEWYLSDASSSVHSASHWLLARLGSVPDLRPNTNPVRDSDWLVNSAGITLLRVPAGGFHQLAKSNDDGETRDVVIGTAFWLADREISAMQFHRFVHDANYPEEKKPLDWEGADPEVSPSPEHPVQQVNWHDAVMFCNWLSHQEGFTAFYEAADSPVPDPAEESGSALWRVVPHANGYRLPSEAEWEYACRAGSSTLFSCGNDEVRLKDYAQFSSLSAEVCGAKLPNAWGFFDMQGNIAEWCEDAYRGNDSRHMIRGGSYLDGPADMESGFRIDLLSGNRIDRVGFRVARSER